MRIVFETGVVRNEDDSDARHKEYRIILLDESYLPEMMALQSHILSLLSRPDLLASFSHDFMKRHFNRHGFVLGTIVEGGLVAFRNVYFPDSQDETWNLGFDLDLNKIERMRVANLQMVCVHPDYRGNSLALKMNRVALDLLREEGGYSHVCATVSPFNHWNIRILINSGFRIAAIKLKYGGKLRFVVYQHLRHPFEFAEKGAFILPLGDIEGHRISFSQGYLGVGLAYHPKNSSKQWWKQADHVIFNRPVRHWLHLAQRRSQPFASADYRSVSAIGGRR